MTKPSDMQGLTIKKLNQIGILSSDTTGQVALKQMHGLSNTTFKVTHPDKGIMAKPLVFKWYKNTFPMFVNRALELEIIT
jgi:hypothetical protein